MAILPNFRKALEQMVDVVSKKLSAPTDPKLSPSESGWNLLDGASKNTEKSATGTIHKKRGGPNCTCCLCGLCEPEECLCGS